MEIPDEMLKEIRESGYDQELVFTQIRKKQERNISSYWKRVGGRQVYLKAIFKKVLNWGLFHFIQLELVNNKYLYNHFLYPTLSSLEYL